MRTKLPEKLYYNIGEVAEAFDVNPSLIRFWEKEFEDSNPLKKTPKEHENLLPKTSTKSN